MTRTRRFRHRPRRFRGSRGAALTEGAFVFPLLVFITFGAFEFGLFFVTQSTTTSSTQAGARLASASLPILTDTAAAIDAVATAVAEDTDAMTGLGTPQTLWVYRADVDGTPEGFAGFSGCPMLACRQYSWNGTTFIHTTGTWPDPDACLFDGDDLDNVGVYVVAKHVPITGLAFGAVTLREHTVAQLEPVPQEEC